ncbi:unnamed protein product, partial [Staurois parvus]
MSAAFQYPSVMPVNAHQCLFISAPSSVPITASLAHFSEGEKLLVYKSY